MTESAPENNATAPDASATQQPAAETPPWGDDFNAEKAWNLVQNLRSDKEKLAAREVLTDDAKAKLAEYDALVEASKTDAERRDDQIKQLQESAAKIPTLEQENLRLKVAIEKGLPADLIGRLQGDTAEALAADADTLLSLIGTQAVSETRTPKPNPAQGASASASPQGQVSKELLAQMTPEQINAARKEGRLNHLLGINS